MIVDKEAKCGSLAPIASPVRYRSGVVEILFFTPDRFLKTCQV